MILIVSPIAKEDIRLKFGSKLRSLRTAAGLSQEKLGELAGLDRTYISSAERGRRNISLDAITRVAEALQISPADFFDTKDSPADQTKRML
jgi:transcriptional regulator with XRE-family HTH domain